ncbi:hypothetical protein DFH08DRAFT_948427 [Mycena albidolilacea]|uniref:Uncharacterized protein n=1 Tax=Mycena albidolilacea TaxID=1033008 RepID=A0AAD7F4W9_9AGAR|nr:hypothetical protein DFH08DRAFT_948427 [Mycena albidolilacea]
MTAALFSVRVRAAVIEQTERTRSRSKADIERLIEESESKITSLESLEPRPVTASVHASLRSDTSFLSSAPFRWNCWPKYLGSRFTTIRTSRTHFEFRRSTQIGGGSPWHPGTLESKFLRVPPKY